MTPDTQITPHQEPSRNKEIPQFAETVFITGGATGTGKATTKLLAPFGTNLIIGSRSYDNRSSAIDELHNIRKETLLKRKPTGITVSFPGDLTDPSSFNFVHERMANYGLDLSTADVVHSAAAGMDGFSSPLIKSLLRLRRSPNPEVDIIALRAQINGWVDASIKNGDTDVNYRGGVNLAETLLDNKRGADPTWFIYYSSLPSTFYPELFGSGEDHGLSFYKGVAQSKFTFEQWLKLNTEELIGHGIFPVVLSANLLYDTNIQMLLKAVAPLVKPEDRASLTDPTQYPTTVDLAKSAVDILRYRPAVNMSESWPVYQFVMAPDQMSKTPPDDFVKKLHLPI